MFVEQLFTFDSSQTGMLAPRITVPSLHLNQNPFMRERPDWMRRLTIRVQILNYFFCVAWDRLWRIKKALRSALSRNRCQQTTLCPSNIYAPHGSFMIFSRRYFEAGGVLDDQLFLYGEEIAVGETCRRLGLPVIYDPSLSVVHNEHQSIGIGVSRATFRHFRRSMRHVFSRYLAPEQGRLQTRQGPDNSSSVSTACSHGSQGRESRDLPNQSRKETDDVQTSYS